MKKKCTKIFYSLAVGKRRLSGYNIVIISFIIVIVYPAFG